MRSASLLLSVSLFLSEADSRANMHAQVSPHRPDVICAYCMRMQALSCKHTSCTSHTISAQSHVCRRALARSHTQNENKLKKQTKQKTNRKPGIVRCKIYTRTRSPYSGPALCVYVVLRQQQVVGLLEKRVALIFFRDFPD